MLLGLKLNKRTFIKVVHYYIFVQFGIFPSFAHIMHHFYTSFIINPCHAEYFYVLHRVHTSPIGQLQGLPWLRICCSQHLSQIEKVGSPKNLSLGKVLAKQLYQEIVLYLNMTKSEEMIKAIFMEKNPKADSKYVTSPLYSFCRN